jgi:hypothetical protein
MPLRCWGAPAAIAMDRTIVAAARAADREILVVDPLTERWSFPRIRDDLHPSPASHAWIAACIAQDMRRRPLASPGPAVAGVETAGHTL